MSRFIKKYLSYSFYSVDNITLNNKTICSNVNSFFFIGDVIKSKYNLYYEKMFIFFNFLYFLNPIKYKKKYTLLHLFYKKLYYYFYKPLKTTNNTFFSSISYNNINKFFSVFGQKNSYISLKSICFLFYKYNYRYINNNNLNSFNKSLLSRYTSLGNNLYIKSYNKYINIYNLITFKDNLLHRSKKLKMKFRRRRIKVNNYIYKYLLYKSKSCFDKVSPVFTKGTYNVFFNKKYNLLKRHTKIRNIIYKSNF